MEFLSPSKKDSSLLLLIDDRTGKVCSSNKDEFITLVDSLDLEVGHTEHLNIRKVNNRYLIGKGQLQRIKEIMNHKQTKQILTNIDVEPKYEKDLTQFLKAPIFDRTAIILDIFAERARTYEGKIQIEMAQVEYTASRLVRGWTHLERQRSGIGMRGGPGEKQLELDRRMLRTKTKKLQKRLDKVKMQRNLSRSARRKAGLPVVSLVGYTNAGKSSIFNLLTSSDAYVCDKLFATLDPTIRRLRWRSNDYDKYGNGKLNGHLNGHSNANGKGQANGDGKNQIREADKTNNGGQNGHDFAAHNGKYNGGKTYEPYEQQGILLADTVGFIENLSKSLMQSFSATFGEIGDSDLLLHIVDITDDNFEIKKQEVNSLLKSLGAHEIPKIMVYNKLDLAGWANGADRTDWDPAAGSYGTTYDEDDRLQAIWVSAHKRYNIDILTKNIIKMTQKPANRPDRDYNNKQRDGNGISKFSYINRI